MPELPLEYIRQSFHFFRSHFSMVVRIQLPFLLLINALALIMEPSVDSDAEGFSNAFIGLTLFSAIITPIYMAATIVYFKSVVQNNPLNTGQCLLLGLSRWRQLLMVYVLTAFAMFGGLIFLIIPGIFIMIRLAFADYICVTENKGPIDSLKESWVRTESCFWVLLNGLAILFMLVTGTEIGVELLLKQAGLNNDIIMNVINILFGLLKTIMTIYAFRVYCIVLSGEQTEQAPDNH